MSKRPKQARDGLEVKVYKGDVEGAIRRLRKRFANARIVFTLKDRKENPSRSDRKRSKFKRAEKR